MGFPKSLSPSDPGAWRTRLLEAGYGGPTFLNARWMQLTDYNLAALYAPRLRVLQLELPLPEVCLETTLHL